MQYLPNSKSPWLTYNEFVPHIMTAENYRQTKGRGGLKATCAGGNGRVILIEYASLSKKYQDLVYSKYGDPVNYIAMQPLKNLVEPDMKARQFYADHILSAGITIPLEHQLKYARQCDWLNVISKVMADKRTLKEELHISIEKFWENIILLIKNDSDTNDLPTSYNRLRSRWKLYKDAGYKGLIEDWRFGNSNARKVTPKIEGMILSLYAQPHKPYMNEVCNEFRKFINGERQVVDLISGEIYNPEDFYVNGKKYLLAESTVDYYVKKPANEAIVNKVRMNKLAYNTMYRPSVKRLAPVYAFSKITMDDLDIPFKTPDGDRAVKSYQIFDVASGAVVGVSFSRDKNIELIREALRDMFRLIIRNEWGIPWEIEFEKHLTSAMTGGVDGDGISYDDILTPGAVFPATRMCIGGNAKEKRAEGFIRVKKYGQQKKRAGFQARHYARLLTNRLNAEQDKTRYEYNDIVENELADIATHNNELHPKQDLYPGMTRWQVLEQTQNPSLVKYQAHQVIQFIGYSTTTSIRAGVARVQYGDYVLPDIALIQKTTYNGEIVAYYLPNDDGHVTSVYLFEDGQFLCEAMRQTGFQEAIVEQGAEDVAIMNQQWGQQKRFDALVKTEGVQYYDKKGELVGNIARVGTIATEKVTATKRAAVVKELPAPAVDYLPQLGKGMSAADRALQDI